MHRSAVAFLVLLSLAVQAAASGIQIYPCDPSTDQDLRITTIDWDQGPVGIIQTPNFPHQVVFFCPRTVLLSHMNNDTALVYLAFWSNTSNVCPKEATCEALVDEPLDTSLNCSQLQNTSSKYGD